MKEKNFFNYNFIIPVFLLIFLFSCSDDSDSSRNDGGSATGKGGSMARFAIKGDRLYIVDGEHLNMFDISEVNDPTFILKKHIGFNIETIFPKDSLLFIGSQNGMHIFDISNPDNPKQLSTYRHIQSCDPVVADDNFAYVTLQTTRSSWCGPRYVNELQVIDIKNLYNPKFVKSRNMVGPQGMSLDGNELFVCDDFLKVFDISYPSNNLEIKYEINVQGNDLILNDNIMMILGDDGFSQYAYENGEITFLSKIKVEK